MIDGNVPERCRAAARCLRRAGAGFGSLALAALLADEAARRGAGRQSARAPAAALPGAGQAGDLPVHARRPVAGRHVRPQAAADAGPRQALAEALPGPDAEPAGLALEVPEARRVGPRGQRAVPARRRRASIDLCVIRSMVADDVNHPGGCLQMNTGERVATRPSLGSWVTYGLGTREPEPARLRRHRPRAADRRRPAVRRQRSCRPRTRARSSPTCDNPIRNLKNAPGQRRSASAGSSTPCAG